MEYDNLSASDRNKIRAVSIYAKEHNILVEHADIDCVKIAICNEDRTEDEVISLAREFKLQMILLTRLIVGINVDITIKYKSVTKEEYNSIVNRMGELLWRN